LYEDTVRCAYDGDETYIILQGIRWHKNLGMLQDDEDASEMEDREPTYGLELFWFDGELTLQNYGNSMNYYLKLAECYDDKYINLERQTRVKNGKK
jgi:hypothetical protein